MFMTSRDNTKTADSNSSDNGLVARMVEVIRVYHGVHWASWTVFSAAATIISISIAMVVHLSFFFFLLLLLLPSS